MRIDATGLGTAVDAASRGYRTLLVEAADFANHVLGRHPHVADDLINLGAVQFEQGHYAEAERWVDTGLDMLRLSPSLRK